MRSDLVVLPEPKIDSDLGLSCGVEPFCVEDFFSQGAVKAFVTHFGRTGQSQRSGAEAKSGFGVDIGAV